MTITWTLHLSFEGWVALTRWRLRLSTPRGWGWEGVFFNIYGGVRFVMFRTGGKVQCRTAIIIKFNSHRYTDFMSLGLRSHAPSARKGAWDAINEDFNYSHQVHSRRVQAAKQYFYATVLELPWLQMFSTGTELRWTLCWHHQSYLQTPTR